MTVSDRSNWDQKLIDVTRVAARVFAERGYDRTSIRDLSKETGVSLSGLYYYIRSKEDLLYLIQERCFSDLTGRLEASLTQAVDPISAVRIFIRQHLCYFHENMAEMKVLSHEAEVLKGEQRTHIQALKRAYVERVQKLLQAARPDGADPRTSALALFGMMNWLYTWYRPQHDMPIDELVNTMTELFLNGYTGSGTTGS